MNALARLLPDFRAVGPTRTPGSRLSGAGAAERDPAQAIAEAEQRGFRGGLESARIESEAQRAEDAGQFEARLAAERARWAEEQADTLAAQIPAGFREIEETLAATAAGVLLPFLRSAATERAIEELRATIGRLLCDRQRPLLRIAGPQDLLELLRQRLGADAAAIEFRVEERAEVRVTADETIIETQLKAWSGRLGEAVE